MSDIKRSETINFGVITTRSMPASYAVLALEASVVIIAIALTAVMLAGVEAFLPAASQPDAIEAAFRSPY